MDKDERERLEDMHRDVRTVRRKVEGLDERTKNIDEKTDRIDNRVFGQDGIESRVNENEKKVSRLNAVGGIILSGSATMFIKIFNLIP